MIKISAFAALAAIVAASPASAQRANDPSFLTNPEVTTQSLPRYRPGEQPAAADWAKFNNAVQTVKHYRGHK